MKEIPLTHGKLAMVDDDDFELVSKFSWRAKLSKGLWYALRCCDEQTSMHRFLIKTSSPHIDHWDGNGLNNQKLNLRPCSVSENSMNRSITSKHKTPFKGVSTCANGKFRARIKKSGRSKFLGYFDDQILAALAYDMAAVEHFGEFARTNYQMGLY